MHANHRSSQRVMGFDDTDSVTDVTDLLFLEHYISGTHPYAESVFLSRVKEGASLLPPGSSPSRVAVHDGTRSMVAEGPDWVLCAVTWRNGNARVSVAAGSEDRAREVMAAATSDVADPEPAERDRVAMGFWHTSSRGPRRTERTLAVEAWSTIRPNYAAATATVLDALMLTTAAGLSGKLLLLHGPPGTGKTTALRALADAWREWCQFDYVLDPEQLSAWPR